MADIIAAKSIDTLRAEADYARDAVTAAELAAQENTTEAIVRAANDCETGSQTQLIGRVPYPHKHWIASQSVGRRIVYTAVLEQVRGGYACRRYDAVEEAY